MNLAGGSKQKKEAENLPASHSLNSESLIFGYFRIFGVKNTNSSDVLSSTW